MIEKMRQLENLLWQQTGGFHPYTCGNDSNHKPLYYRSGVLICHDCGYTQSFSLEQVSEWFEIEAMHDE